MHAGSTRRKPRHCAAQASQSNHIADLQRRGLLQLPALALLCKTLGVHAAEGMTLVALSYFEVRVFQAPTRRAWGLQTLAQEWCLSRTGQTNFPYRWRLTLLCRAIALGISITQQCVERPSMPAQVPDGWMFGTGGAAGGKGFSGASGTRRALAWCAAVSTL